MDIEKTNKHIDFIQSALAITNCLHTTTEIENWLKQKRAETKINIRPVALNQLNQWSYSTKTQNLVHQSRKFFSIDGIHVKSSLPVVPEWQQPIINQPEIGYLGFLVKKINGILHFLVQAKTEPGNIDTVQLSPTLQATKSNYTQVHKGKKPQYLDYFKKAPINNILLDQLQSEQGARFLKKRNRNIIVLVNEEIPESDNFRWLTLAQIKYFIHQPNYVNMDTRTVISCIPFGNFQAQVAQLARAVSDKTINQQNRNFFISAIDASTALHSTDNLISWITRRKVNSELEVQKTDLKKLENWNFTDQWIEHREKKFFSIIGVDIAIENREVQAWQQPMVKPAHEGLIAFIVKPIQGITHFLVQAKLECGNFDTIELAPTIQTLTGNYKAVPTHQIPFLEYVLQAQPQQIIYDVYQSEEGGRFFKEQNRNMIILADERFEQDVPENFTWMTLNQMIHFIQFNNYLNIQARSLISALQFI